MKKKILAAMLAALAVGAMALTGCSTGGTTTEDTSSDSTVVTSSDADVSSEDNSAADVSSEDTASDETDTPDNVIVDPVAFETKFAENPIDAAYTAESANAMTNLDIINLEEKYADLWKAEIDHAYQQLFTHSGMEHMSDDQRKWNNYLENELESLKGEVTSTGSMASLEYGVLVRKFYREKAEKLYKELYTVDTDYTYAYTA